MDQVVAICEVVLTSPHAMTRVHIQHHHHHQQQQQQQQKQQQQQEFLKKLLRAMRS